MSTESATLQEVTEEFADELTATVRRVLGEGQPKFVALVNDEQETEVTRLSVRPFEAVPIQVTIDEKPALELTVSFYCIWDHHAAYLAVEGAKIEVRPVGREPPLFRYEYVRGMQETLPCAHLHVHAHRDEFVYQLVRGGKGRRAKRRSRKLDQPKPSNYPVLADVHFPLGGHRFRPCLEDVLQVLRRRELRQVCAIDARPKIRAWVRCRRCCCARPWLLAPSSRSRGPCRRPR